MDNLDSVQRVPGVYLMLDLDEKPIYAGKSTNVRKRLKDHLIRQRSDVVTDGLLDVYEVRSVLIWFQSEACALPLVHEDSGGFFDHLDILESAVIRQFKPRWNRSKHNWDGPIPTLSLDNPDRRIEVIETPEALAVRQERTERLQNRLLHMLRALRKARVSGASPKVLHALSLHALELSKMAERGRRSQQGRLESDFLD
jgi:hypothetical protein